MMLVLVSILFHCASAAGWVLLGAIHAQEGKARSAADRGLVQMAALHAAEARRIERVLGGIGRRAR